MSKSRKVHNPNPTPVVYDTAGHTLDAHTTKVVEVDESTERLIASGRLLAFADRRNRAPVDVPAEEAPTPKTQTAKSAVTVTSDGTKNGEK